MQQRIADDIAIIGMACMFPGAPSLSAYWQNILGKIDALSDPPPEAWASDIFFDPNSTENDRVYCKRGGYLGPIAEFDPLAYGIMPAGIEGGEPDQWLALKVAYEALADARYLERLREREDERHRTAVILGKGTYLNHGNLNMVQHSLVVEQTIQVLRSLHPEYDEAQLAAVRQELRRQLPPFNAEAAPGLVPNIVAGRIANRLDLMGPTYTVDAACASSLIAVEIAMRELRSGSCDLALAGGVHVTTPIPILTLFCQLNALSRRQQIRPFDRAADGTILGEGLGMLVLKRRADAERDGDRIYALIKAVGTASDGRAMGVLAPRLDGQVLALRRAYELAGIDPASVSLIEAHGTGTPVGDRSEIQALSAVLGPREGQAPTCALGSVKSMIGHTMPAAGVAGLIKVALSLYYKILPPTINCDQPDPSLEASRLYINSVARPWFPARADLPRRAGVNAFGFGGINAHAILEEAPQAIAQAAPGPWSAWGSELVIVEGASREELVARGQRILRVAGTADLADLAYSLSSERRGLPWRLAIVADSPADLRAKLKQALGRLGEPGCRQIKDQRGIYFFAKPLYPEGKLAFLFPGEGSQYPNMLADLCMRFPAVRACFERIDRVFVGHRRGYLPSEVIFPRPGPDGQAAQIWRIDSAVEAVLTANEALFSLLGQFGVRPDMIVGHSTGEYSALRAAGALALDDERFIGALLELNRTHQALQAPQAVLLALGTERAQAEALIAEAGAPLYVGMENCPHQTVVVGEPAAAERLIALLKARGLIFETLSFDRAYHTPLFAAYRDSLRDFFASLPLGPAQTPAYSCTSAAPYPAEPEAIRALALEHWVSPVRFRETVQALYADGARIFVEVGARGNLSAFVGDTLRGQPHLAIPADVQHRPGLTQLNHLLAMLAAQGVPLDLGPLYQGRDLRRIDLETGGAPASPARRRLKLRTGWVSAAISPEAAERLRPAPSPAHSPPALAATAPAPAIANGISRNGHLPAAPVPPAPPGAPASASGRQQVLQAHLELMERFIGDQQILMQRFLGGAPAPAVPLTPQPAAMQPAAPQPTVPQPATPAIPSPEQAPAAPAGPEQTKAKLLRLVSERTGYPVELLDLGANVEADLGIDSIKRIEILGAFAQDAGVQLPDLDQIAGLKTLGELAAALAERAGQAGQPAAAATGAGTSELPFIRDIRSLVPGQELEAECVLSLADDRFLLDHTLGRAISDEDPGLWALPVVPLTVSTEILAEAAAALRPGAKVIGLREVRAYRWISVEGGQARLRVVARADTAGALRVAIYDADAPAGATPLIEACADTAAAYPAPPAPIAAPAGGPSRWAPETIYREGMFHGPAFQAVASVERSGPDGSVAVLQALPADGLIAGQRAPAFVAEPVILDAAGQVVGLWTVERLERGFVVFPYRCAAIEIYGPALAPGERAECRVRIALTDDGRTSSDIDVLGPDGRLRLRLKAWEDRRFDIPRALYRFILDPRGERLSAPWAAPAADGRFSGAILRGLDELLLGSQGDFWLKVLAHLVLGAAERESWRGLSGPPRRRVEWLLGRIAAKEAARDFVRARYGERLCLADIAVVAGEAGRPELRGAWAARLAAPLAVSLAHSEGVAVALVGEGRGVGVDLEPLRRTEQAFDETAFTASERTLLSSLAQSEGGDWPLRLWCAKEALGKALGQGLAGGPQAIVTQTVDPRSGAVTLRLAGDLAGRFPQLSRPLIAHTAREGEFLVASVLEV